MSYFKFNGIDSRDLGLIVTQTPFRPSWAEQVEEITIPGRPEVIKNPNGIYENQLLTINCVISDASKIRLIYSTLSGEGVLILSTNLNEYMNVRVEPLISQGVALDMAELPITFDCYPFAYKIQPTQVTIQSTSTEVVNNSTIYSAPIIEIGLTAAQATILKGDVNMDGKIDATDAALVLRELANISAGTPTFTPEQRYAADMDDSGTLTAWDASAILQLYAELSGQGADITPTTPTENVVITTNGESLVVGLPAQVVANGFTVYIDCGLYLIYYKDTDDKMVNIMNYSSLDLPMLHEGSNYMYYTDNASLVRYVKVTINDRYV